MSAHTYASAYPPPDTTPVDPAVARFFERFYAASDDRDAPLDDYVGLFAPDAVFVLASKKSVGHDEIRITRQGMWDAVAARKHTVPQIFPFGPGAQEFMLHGTVDLRLKNGTETALDWAGRAKLVRSDDDGEWRMGFYQVYLDTGAAAAYKK